MIEPKLIKQDCQSKGKFLHLYHLNTEMSNGKKHGPYEMVSRKSQEEGTVIEGNLTPDAVVIIARTADRRLVVLREYRHPVGRWIWDLPAGCLEKGQSILDCAKTELLQETGMELKNHNIESIKLNCLSSPGMTDESLALVWCQLEDTKAKENKAEHGEYIETHLMGIPELKSLLIDRTEFMSSRLAVIAHMYCKMADMIEQNHMINTTKTSGSAKT